MKKIFIKNIGPIQEADITLRNVNVVIGPQSSGKSTILKIASYCSWLEKRIEINQSAKFVKKPGVFLDGLVHFHKMEGYLRRGAVIKYASDYMTFTYEYDTDSFSFRWKPERWNYVRSKILYIPAERNMVSAIPNWYEVKLQENNIRSFMAEWENARKSFADNNHLAILNLAVSYYYDRINNVDKVSFGDDETLGLTNTSSGLQTAIPLFVIISYLSGKESKKKESVSDVNDRVLISGNILDYYIKQYGVQRVESGLRFPSIGLFESYNKTISNYVINHSGDFFIEEPELNLFPDTQYDLIKWLVAVCKKQNSSFFITTHSPYVMTCLNNLILGADKIKEGKDISGILSPDSVAPFEDVSAYSISDGHVSDLLCKSSRLIDARALDDASEHIGNDFDRLLAL